MTTTTQIADTSAAAISTSQDTASPDKWPIPYSAMFMVTVSAVLWYGIYSAGAAIASIIG